MSMTPEELQALNARRGYTPPAAPAEPTAPLYVGGPPPEQGGGRGAEYVPPCYLNLLLNLLLTPVDDT
jgi:hypothetical protein